MRGELADDPPVCLNLASLADRRPENLALDTCGAAEVSELEERSWSLPKTESSQGLAWRTRQDSNL